MLEKISVKKRLSSKFPLETRLALLFENASHCIFATDICYPLPICYPYLLRPVACFLRYTLHFYLIASLFAPYLGVPIEGR